MSESDMYLRRRAAISRDILESIHKTCRLCIWFASNTCLRADVDARVEPEHYCRVRDDAGQYCFAPTFRVLWVKALDRMADGTIGIAHGLHGEDPAS